MRVNWKDAEWTEGIQMSGFNYFSEDWNKYLGKAQVEWREEWWVAWILNREAEFCPISPKLRWGMLLKLHQQYMV